MGTGEKEAEEGVRPKVRRSPEMPSQGEIDEHNIDHGTFRARCPHCVRGRGVSYGHKKGDGSEREVPVVAMDYSLNLIVLKTLPGTAQAVAYAIDAVKWAEVIGTVAGDDTICVIVKPPEAAGAVLAKFQALMA